VPLSSLYSLDVNGFSEEDLSCQMHLFMAKLQLAGQNMGRFVNSKSGCVCTMQLSCFETKLPNLMLKIRPKQLLGSLPLDIALPG
jgi:hypothetical protein